jgi:hypothetical protein
MNDYSRDFSEDISDAVLMLNLNIGDDNKKNLTIRLAQLGIDNYRNMEMGNDLPRGNWYPLEGQQMGRKLPIVFAGLVLDDNDMLNIGKWENNNPNGGLNPVFQEDLNIFRVTEADVGRHVSGVNTGCSSGTCTVACAPEYTLDQVGLPEWGSRHYGPYANLCNDNADWAAAYRSISIAGMLGTALAVNLMGIKENWDNNLFFDYYDRAIDMERSLGYFITDPRLSGSQSTSQFTFDIWIRYRNSTGCIWTSVNPSTRLSQYDCDGDENYDVDCSSINSCLDYNGNTRAEDYDPCNVGICEDQEPSELFEADYYVDNSVADCLTYDPVTRSCGGGKYTSFDTIQEGVNVLALGDVLAVREGVYRESVTIQNSGTADARITIRNYPGEEVVLDGTEAVTGWQPVASDDSFLTVQGEINPNWTNIYKVKIHENQLPFNTEKFMLFENVIHSRIARWPDQELGYGIDVNLFIPLESEAYGQTDFLLDSDALTRADDYWTGAWIDVFSHAANGWVIRRGIASSSQSATTITFDTPLAEPISSGTTPDSYSIVNHPHVLDSPGEFAHTMEPDDNGDYTFYFWPKDVGNLFSSISIPTKSMGIYAYNKSYVTIDGIKVMGYIGGGMEFLTYSGYIDSIVARNCIVEDVGGNGIYFVRANNSTIEYCNISRVEGRGAFINTGSNGLIQYCEVRDSSSTGISFYYMTNGRILYNILHGCIGAHCNGVSVYNNSTRNLVAYNRFLGSNLAFNGVEDLIVFGNVVNWHEKTFYVVAKWANTISRGYQVFAHNTITEDSSNASLVLPIRHSAEQEVGDVPHNYIFNNVLDGLVNWEPVADSEIEDRTYNFYTGYGWTQGSGWSLAEGEIDGTHIALEDLFTYPGEYGEDYSLKEESPLIGKGKSLDDYLNDPESPFQDFPDFDFTKDIAGNPWNNPPSIGAYEYQAQSLGSLSIWSGIINSFKSLLSQGTGQAILIGNAISSNANSEGESIESVEVSDKNGFRDLIRNKNSIELIGFNKEFKSLLEGLFSRFFGLEININSIALGYVVKDVDDMSGNESGDGWESGAEEEKKMVIRFGLVRGLLFRQVSLKD